MCHSHSDCKGFKPSRDEGELNLTGLEPTDDERSDMESSREAKHAYSEVISPSLLASLREPLPGLFCRHNSSLELATTGKVLLLESALKRSAIKMIFF